MVDLYPIECTVYRVVYRHQVDFSQCFYKDKFGVLSFFYGLSFNTNSQTDVAYLDFREAFDSVAHKELLFKLWTFGITAWLCMEVNYALSHDTPLRSYNYYSKNTSV